MSFLRSLAKLFGSKKKHKRPPSEVPVDELSSTEDMLIKKRELLEEKIEQERVTARKNSTTNKRVAMQALDRKKRYEKQLLQINDTIDTVIQQRGVLENANMNADVLTTIMTAKEALKFANQFMSVDNVHDMINDIADSQDLTQELSEAICDPVAFETNDELLEELEELERDELNKQLLNTDTIPDKKFFNPAVLTFKSNALSKTKVPGLAD